MKAIEPKSNHNMAELWFFEAVVLCSMHRNHTIPFFGPVNELSCQVWTRWAEGEMQQKLRRRPALQQGVGGSEWCGCAMRET